ncbi:MMPL family transporter [Nocardia lijiangensis]|uniref:MMPL family transporter n=1 Tax=Nocardia lijiangensis TaxID=299618 RepID=UPI00083401E7|nr:MMPL family transporter [Nocardia lijiangensis]
MIAWARFVMARPRTVLGVAVVVMGLCGLFGAGAAKQLSAGGVIDPNSESALVDRLVTEHFGPQNPDVVAIYTAPEGQTLEDIGPRVRAAIAAIDPALLARPIESYWNSVPPRTNFLRSPDKRHALAVVFTAGDETERIAAYPELEAALRVPGIDTELSGYSALSTEITAQSQRDLLVAESISLPVTLLLLVLVFGGVVAASLPVVVGMLAVAGSMGAIRVISEVTEVSTFAVNIASLLGLGMAIDYGLFLVNRFREEIADGHDVPRAIERTCATAGRTVAFSALLLICAFAGTFVFPQAVLRSLGFGAIAAVGLAAALSLSVLPAMLTLFGPRIGRAGTSERTERFWGRIVDAVLRRPGVVTIAVGAVLLALAAPLSGIRLGDIDHRALPAGNGMRETVERLTADFPAASSGVTAVLRGVDGSVPNAAAVDETLRALGSVSGVRSVLQVGRAEDFVVLHAFLTATDRSEAAAAAVRDIRAMQPPPDTVIQVGGDTAATRDSVDSIVARMPLMVLAMVLATMGLLLAAFRSIVLPLKAVAMAFLSLAATFGVLTWIFSDGHLAGVLGVSVGPLAAGMVVLIIAVVFGLSTDYEVFLLSRMVEAHNAGADTAESVRAGTVKTARVITAAAVLLVLVTGAFTLSPLTPMRFLGIGMIIALVIDATLVRMLLVPALVQLMGGANWWMPGSRRPRRHVATVLEKTGEPAATHS